MKDILSKEKILEYSHCGISPKDIVLLQTVDSTNLYCKELTKTQPSHQTLVIAETQTAGKGRMGRAFFSPKSTGIYMSLILDCKFINIPPTLLTIAAGIAVCRVLRTHCSAEASIKWVNDIFLNGKKVCGILAESVSSLNFGSPTYIIIGIGINITTPTEKFPDDLKLIAGSIFPNDISRNELIAQITNELHNIYTAYDSEKLIDEYKSYSLVLDNEISFVQNGKTYKGIAKDINQDGNLIVCIDNGKTMTLKSGEISLGSENFIKKV